MLKQNGIEKTMVVVEAPPSTGSSARADTHSFDKIRNFASHIFVEDEQYRETIAKKTPYKSKLVEDHQNILGEIDKIYNSQEELNKLYSSNMEIMRGRVGSFVRDELSILLHLYKFGDENVKTRTKKAIDRVFELNNASSKTRESIIRDLNLVDEKGREVTLEKIHKHSIDATLAYEALKIITRSQGTDVLAIHLYNEILLTSVLSESHKDKFVKATRQYCIDSCKAQISTIVGEVGSLEEFENEAFKVAPARFSEVATSDTYINGVKFTNRKSSDAFNLAISGLAHEAFVISSESQGQDMSLLNGVVGISMLTNYSLNAAIESVFSEIKSSSDKTEAEIEMDLTIVESIKNVLAEFNPSGNLHNNDTTSSLLSGMAILLGKEKVWIDPNRIYSQDVTSISAGSESNKETDVLVAGYMILMRNFTNGLSLDTSGVKDDKALFERFQSTPQYRAGMAFNRASVEKPLLYVANMGELIGGPKFLLPPVVNALTILDSIEPTSTDAKKTVKGMEELNLLEKIGFKLPPFAQKNLPRGLLPKKTRFRIYGAEELLRVANTKRNFPSILDSGIPSIVHGTAMIGRTAAAINDKMKQNGTIGNGQTKPIPFASIVQRDRIFQTLDARNPEFLDELTKRAGLDWVVDCLKLGGATGKYSPISEWWIAAKSNLSDKLMPLIKDRAAKGLDPETSKLPDEKDSKKSPYYVVTALDKKLFVPNSEKPSEISGRSIGIEAARLGFKPGGEFIDEMKNMVRGIVGMHEISSSNHTVGEYRNPRDLKNAANSLVNAIKLLTPLNTKIKAVRTSIEQVHYMTCLEEIYFRNYRTEVDGKDFKILYQRALLECVKNNIPVYYYEEGGKRFFRVGKNIRPQENYILLQLKNKNDHNSGIQRIQYLKNGNTKASEFDMNSLFEDPFENLARDAKSLAVNKGRDVKDVALKLKRRAITLLKKTQTTDSGGDEVSLDQLDAALSSNNLNPTDRQYLQNLRNSFRVNMVTADVFMNMLLNFEGNIPGSISEFIFANMESTKMTDVLRVNWVERLVSAYEVANATSDSNELSNNIGKARMKVLIGHAMLARSKHGLNDMFENPFDKVVSFMSEEMYESLDADEFFDDWDKSNMTSDEIRTKLTFYKQALGKNSVEYDDVLETIKDLRKDIDEIGFLSEDRPEHGRLFQNEYTIQNGYNALAELYGSVDTTKDVNRHKQAMFYELFEKFGNMSDIFKSSEFRDLILGGFVDAQREAFIKKYSNIKDFNTLLSDLSNNGYFLDTYMRNSAFVNDEVLSNLINLSKENKERALALLADLLVPFWESKIDVTAISNIINSLYNNSDDLLSEFFTSQGFRGYDFERLVDIYSNAEASKTFLNNFASFILSKTLPFVGESNKYFDRNIFINQYKELANKYLSNIPTRTKKELIGFILKDVREKGLELLSKNDLGLTLADFMKLFVETTFIVPHVPDTLQIGFGVYSKQAYTTILAMLSSFLKREQTIGGVTETFDVTVIAKLNSPTFRTLLPLASRYYLSLDKETDTYLPSVVAMALIIGTFVEVSGGASAQMSLYELGMRQEGMIYWLLKESGLTSIRGSVINVMRALTVENVPLERIAKAIDGSEVSGIKKIGFVKNLIEIGKFLLPRVNDELVRDIRRNLIPDFGEAYMTQLPVFVAELGYSALQLGLIASLSPVLPIMETISTVFGINPVLFIGTMVLSNIAAGVGRMNSLARHAMEVKYGGNRPVEIEFSARLPIAVLTTSLINNIFFVASPFWAVVSSGFMLSFIDRITTKVVQKVINNYFWSKSPFAIWAQGRKWDITIARLANSRFPLANLVGGYLKRNMQLSHQWFKRTSPIDSSLEQQSAIDSAFESIAKASETISKGMAVLFGLKDGPQDGEFRQLKRILGNELKPEDIKPLAELRDQSTIELLTKILKELWGIDMKINNTTATGVKDTNSSPKTK